MVLGRQAANAYFCRHERKKLLIGKLAQVSWNYQFDGWFLQWRGEHIVATASLLEVWIDETERRTWFLFEGTRSVEP